MTKKKRARVIYAKENQLKAAWGSDGCGNTGLTYAWGPGVPKADSWLLYEMLSAPRFGPMGDERPTILAELMSRGYDINTLKFSIDKAASEDDA